jgi:hypothetical protein
MWEDCFLSLIQDEHLEKILNMFMRTFSFSSKFLHSKNLLRLAIFFPQLHWSEILYLHKRKYYFEHNKHVCKENVISRLAHAKYYHIKLHNAYIWTCVGLQNAMKCKNCYEYIIFIILFLINPSCHKIFEVISSFSCHLSKMGLFTNPILNRCP